VVQPPLEPSISGKLVGAPADRTPLPELARGTDTRVLDAWCEWLGALATDAEAALAAAIAYRELDAHGRTFLAQRARADSVRLKVPRIAVYAPLLAVESDSRTFASASRLPWARPKSRPLRASPFRHFLRAAPMVCASPPWSCLCIWTSFRCWPAPFALKPVFLGCVHDPSSELKRAPGPGHHLEGVELERTPLKALIDELSHAVLSQRRNGARATRALRVFADLFGPNIGGSTPPPPSAP